MRVSLPYGDETVAFDIDGALYAGSLEAPHVAPAPDPVAEIARAIDAPLGCGPLSGIVKHGDKVGILCDDLTRATPVKLILPILIERLINAGVAESDITIIMALGSHRYMTADEMRARVGDGVYERFKVVNSEFNDESALVNLGRTDDGVEIEVTRAAMEVDVRIAVGSVVPHPVMGFSGGAKMLFPGVTGERTVAQFHMLAGLADVGYYGRDDSPFRLVIEKWAEKIGLHFIVNTVLTPGLELYRCVAGHYVTAHRAGVEHAKRAQGCRVDRKADICVVSSYPSDSDMWQSGKGICCAVNAVREGGAIILVSPNYEGVGPHPEYVKFVGMDARDAHAELTKFMRGEPVDGDPLALSVGTAVSKIRSKYRLVMVGDGVSKADTEAAGIKWYPKDGLQAAVDETIAEYISPRVVSISHGSETFIYA